MERTEEPDRHAGNDARLAARLDETDDAAAGGQRGEDVGGEFEALREGGVSVRPPSSTRRGIITIVAVVLVLLLLLLLRRGQLQRGRDVLVGLLVGDDVDVLSFLFLELSDLGGEGASPNDEPSWSFPPVQVRRAASPDWVGELGREGGVREVPLYSGEFGGRCR